MSLSAALSNLFGICAAFHCTMKLLKHLSIQGVSNMLSNEEIRKYLNRLGIPDIQPPSLEYLSALHQAHVRTISWQTVDIIAGKPAPIDLASSVNLMLSGRSGYCYHLNGAFSMLLKSLGFEVNWHRAGVQPPGVEPRIDSFHLGLTVTLPLDNGGTERYILDVGLGDMPFTPLPLLPGEYEQGAFLYKVEPSTVADGGWRLVHDPLASIVGVDVAPEPLHDLQVFIPKHEFYSRSPNSPWSRLFLLRQRHANGGNELRGCIWSKRQGDKVQKEELRSKSQWLEVLADIFHEHLVHYSHIERDELWNTVYRMHEEWKQEREAEQRNKIEQGL